MRQRALTALVLIITVLPGCGGGGGSGGSGGGGGGGGSGYGNTLPPTTGPGDAENFFPVATGDKWNYYVRTTGSTGNAPPTFLETVTVTGTRTVLGVSATVFLDIP